MTKINIELPEHLHTRIKLKAIKEGKILQDVLTELLEKRMKQ